MLTVFFTELCFSSSMSVLRFCIKWKMSETFIILNLSPRGPDESGEWRASVVAVHFNLICWLVDLATKWLSYTQKHTRRKNSNTQACFAIRAISFFSCEIYRGIYSSGNGFFYRMKRRSQCWLQKVLATCICGDLSISFSKYCRQICPQKLSLSSNFGRLSLHG